MNRLPLCTVNGGVWRVLQRVALCALLSVGMSVGVTVDVAAQASPRVPLGDPAYGDIDNIVGSGLVRYPIYGQKPYTVREITRLVADANAELVRHGVSRSVEKVLRRLTLRFPVDSVTPSHGAAVGIREVVRSASVEVMQLHSPPRALQSEPVGDVAADINPILDNRNGEYYAQGLTLGAQVEESWRVGNRFSLQLEPRLSGGHASSGAFVDGRLENASVGASALNIAFELGRQPVVWGEGMAGNLLMSPSSQSLNMLRATTEGLFHLPSVFRYLGQLRGTAFVADLGPHQTFPHSKIIAYKMDSRVNPYVEIGLSYLVEEGGKGSPQTAFVDRVIDLIPALLTLSYHQTQFSNKLAGGEGRFRIPPLHNMQLFTEYYIDDVSRRFTRAWIDGGMITGVSMAQLGPQGAVGATAEFHHTGVRYYRHTPFTSGIAYNRTLLGDPLNSQGDGGYFSVRFDRGGRARFGLNGALERFGGDVWGTHADTPEGQSFHFVKVMSRPAEWRHRIDVRWDFAVRTRQLLTLDAAVERVHNANFVGGSHRLDGLGHVRYSWLAW